MKKKHTLCLAGVAFAVLLVGSGTLASCSSSSQNSNEVSFVELPDSLEIVGSALTGDNPEVMIRAYDDSGYLVLARTLKNNKTDTVFRNDEAWQPCQAVKTKSGYAVACQRDDGDPVYGNEYAVFLTNAKEKSGKMLLIDKQNEELTATGYVINPDSETIELSSYEEDEDKVMLYSVVYNFRGKRLSDNSRNIPIKKVTKVSKKVSKKVSASSISWDSFFCGSSSPENYVWECSYCHRKANGSQTPQGEGLCPERPTGYGGHWGHQWVKIRKVE